MGGENSDTKPLNYLCKFVHFKKRKNNNKDDDNDNNQAVIVNYQETLGITKRCQYITKLEK